MDIVIQKLTHVYMEGTPFEQRALTGVDLRIPSGSFAAIIGATGSGKSTLIQHIAGLLKPSRGWLRIGNIEIGPDTRDSSRLRGKVGVVFQYPEHQLFEETVAKDIAFGPLNLGLSALEANRRVERAMEWVGLPRELASRSPFHLSGGQMRRAAVAGVLAMEPDILVLDEPTAGLDPVGRRQLLDRIAWLRRKRAMTVILVSHSMEEAARYADRLYILHRGRKVMEGLPADLFTMGDRLAKWGLEEPEAVRLVRCLNERLNPPLPESLLTVEDLEEAIVARWEEGKSP
ncbi:energy-coupling factor transport system ATP-binding protein [Melghirimyces profundicolus]|uniref:Energy-coupling factor transporter ATP-binding protein EcfA2 n=1 Tax=Melghirimyces profundicolus TaxID=1242148 RepID=A0A2T6BQ40_9BACL|nr:energy-coupling factor transporter ATPase [Melghirimyces profundicolus]PTX58211.1 energy-coupling factor transport system ATP-binding protein [Melghirimyces profundicolus]